MSPFAKHPLLPLLAALVCLCGSLRAEVTVDAAFEPSAITLGDRARYTVTIRETDPDSMPDPGKMEVSPPSAPDGLTLRGGRESVRRETRIVNFETQYRLVLGRVFEAVPSETGSFTVPAHTIRYKGETYRVPAARLTVGERSASAGPSADELVFLRANVPDTLYVGQSAAFTLKLYVSENVSLRGLNDFERNADGFTLSELPDEPRESIERVDGRRYRVLGWPMKLTPISAGEQTLDFQFTATGRLPDSRGGTRSRSPFGNSIFDGFFGRTERFNVFTDPIQVRVKPLPEDNRPDTFTGAIGDFNMSVAPDTESVRQGEPVTLGVEVSGTGNFGRMRAPALPAADGWRAYDPEADFAPDDALGLSGVKRFDYVFIPEKSGTLKLPEVAFAFFDPEVEKYVELSSPPITVDVAAKPNAGGKAPSAAPPESADAPAGSAETGTDEWFAPERTSGNPRVPGAPWYRRPLFYAANLVAVAAVVASAVMLRRRRRMREDADYALARRAAAELKKTRAALRRARAAGDHDTFYAEAQRAVRLAATLRFRHNLRSAATGELATRFRDAGLPETDIAAMDELFRAADGHRFSGQPTGGGSSEDSQKLETLLRHLRGKF